jgi:hypothetical protein
VLGLTRREESRCTGEIHQRTSSRSASGAVVQERHNQLLCSIVAIGLFVAVAVLVIPGPDRFLLAAAALLGLLTTFVLLSWA